MDQGGPTDAVAEATGTEPVRRGGPADLGDAKGRPVMVLVHVDTTDGVRLVTYHEFLGRGGTGAEAHRVVRRGGTIAGVGEGRALPPGRRRARALRGPLPAAGLTGRLGAWRVVTAGSVAHPPGRTRLPPRSGAGAEARRRATSVPTEGAVPASPGPGRHRPPDPARDQHVRPRP